MSIPALSKAYSTRGNTVIPDTTTAANVAKSNAFNLMQHLLNTAAGGTLSGVRDPNSVWTCRGSSDGTTQAMDGVNRITDITKIIQDNDGSNHSWIVLYNAPLGYELLIGWNSATTASIHISAAEHAAGGYGGGSLIHDPFASREFVWGQGGSSPTVSANVGFISDVVTGGTNYTHFVTTTDGQFHFHCSRSGNGLFTTSVALFKTINNTSDTRNVVLWRSVQQFNRGAPSFSDVATTSSNTALLCPNGSIQTGGGVMQATFGNSSATYPGSWGTDQGTGAFLAFPCHVVTTTPQTAYRGQIPDVYMVGIATIAGSYPSAAAQTHVIFGDYVMACPGVNLII